MHKLENKEVLVVGLGLSGRAAASLLARRGARVTAVDGAGDPNLQQAADGLRAQGVDVRLGITTPPPKTYDLVVMSPGLPATHPLAGGCAERGVPVIGELELGWQQSHCLNVSITGTNGKTTTTELVERMLTHCQRRTLAAGNIGRPLCDVADQTRELDFLTLEVSSFQLETIHFFRPVVAVLLNLTPDHLDRYSGMEEYIRAKARLFINQQLFDWAIIQFEALQQMEALKLPIPSKIITFSALDDRADLILDRSLIISRIEGWTGPLLNQAHTRLCGPHNAENLMAALAVGRVLRLPLELVVEALKTYEPAAHRCELVAERAGVRYYNDSKATNLDAVQKALLAMPTSALGEPNVWLIAGGKDKGFGFEGMETLLRRRVKGVFLMGETREKIRQAWAPHAACVLVENLAEAVREAARRAGRGDVVLLSPACSSFDQFKNYQHRGEMFRSAVLDLKKTQ